MVKYIPYPNNMKFRQLFPVALSISFTSGIYILIAQYFQVSALWLPYISWTAYFLDGSNPKRLIKQILCLTGGMLIGVFTVLLLNPVTSILGPTFALPVIVFFMVLVILLLELVKEVDIVPVYFFSYSSYFAYYYGKFGGESATPLNILPEFWLLLMIGLGLGLLTSEIRKRMIY
ncbi:DUF1097 domain-containing protein [Candidatus Gottesmanbacteria bacterium]|nr:DUF1097 domain-containing protein [Candidatus Gottesmanbacteria bacterium]